MKKFTFVFLHSFLAILTLALGVFTLFALDLVFKVLGVVIILCGVLSLFNGTYFVTGVIRSLGIKWYSTNIGEKFVVLVVFLLLGGCTFFLLDFVELPRTIGSIAVLITGLATGYKMYKEKENEEGDYELSNFSIILGKIVPVIYILGAGIYMILKLYNLTPIIAVVIIVLGVVLHLVRMIKVCKYELN